ncbi:MAG: aminotransferase class V-fold PLP-dependent enzyme [Thermoanaerobaculia bacterium]|nr:aminotransferase class V-fold PLP-dependent enzyme [Thermoanaerobaculia bacterium]
MTDRDKGIESTWRDETPGLENVIHLNSAGASLMPRPVLDVMREHLRLESEIGGYEAEAAQSDQIAEAYDAVAELLHTRAGNVAMACRATQAFAQAFSTVDWCRGDVLLTSTVDYTSQQILYLSMAKRFGVDIVRAPDLPEGGVDPQAVESLLESRRPRMVTMTWIPTHSGIVQDLVAVGAACRRHDVPFVVDACQAVGQMPVDVEELQCDYLSATGRKFLRGPRGIGFLYCSDRALRRGDYPLYIDMRGAKWVAPGEFSIETSARRFEEWEHSYINVLGLGAAARYASAVGAEVARDRAWGFARELRDWAGGVDGVRALERGTNHSAIVTLEVEGLDAGSVVSGLRQRGINTGATLQWYGLADLAPRGVVSALRVSPHYFNSGEDLRMFREALVDLIRT